jgi:hypothetical protein
MPAHHFGSVDPNNIAARKNMHLECGVIIGQLNIATVAGETQFIAIPCTELKSHITPCRFVGVELIITRRER